MAVQNRTNNTVATKVISGTMHVRGGSLHLAGYAGADVAELTLLSRDVSSGDLVPFSNEAAVDGTEIPVGLLALGEAATTAEVVAGKTVNYIVLGTNLLLNEDLVVCQAASGNLDTEIASQNRTIRDVLQSYGIGLAKMIATTGLEN